MNKNLFRSVLACSLLSAFTSMLAAQDVPADPTTGEQSSGQQVGKIDVTVGGKPHTITYYQGDEGEALFQGDIILGPVSSLEKVTNGASLQSLEEDILFGLAIRDRDSRWPDGKLRYFINESLAHPSRIYDAIAEWESATPIRFEKIAQRTGNFVEFVSGSGCSSAIGMVGGQQFIRLHEDCTTGNTVHEIGHALGLHHEQARSDRTQHVRIFTSNIIEGKAGNFSQDPTIFEDVGDYCHGSIMHYGPYAFSKDRKKLKTIETRPEGIRIGQRDGLAACDIETINRIYPAAQDPVDEAFEGELVFFPEGCQAAGKCFLRNDLIYTDPANVRWKAGRWVEGSPVTVETGTTDGASIPKWAQPIIGEPFDKEYLSAAVVHDHYCYKENQVRTWRQTHRMFYNALKALGVPDLKSKLMYAGVYIGGPKWRKLVPGENCGPNCINDALASNPSLQKKNGDVLVFREDAYDTPDFRQQFALMRQKLEASPDMPLSQIEGFAQALKPDDEFINFAATHFISGANDPMLVGPQ